MDEFMEERENEAIIEEVLDVCKSLGLVEITPNKMEIKNKFLSAWHKRLAPFF